MLSVVIEYPVPVFYGVTKTYSHISSVWQSGGFSRRTNVSPQIIFTRLKMTESSCNATLIELEALMRTGHLLFGLKIAPNRYTVKKFFI